MKIVIIAILIIVAVSQVFFKKKTESAYIADSELQTEPNGATARKPASLPVPETKFYDDVAKAYEKIEQNKQLEELNSETAIKQEQLTKIEEFLKRTVPIERTKELLVEAQSTRLEKVISKISTFTINKNLDISDLNDVEISELNKTLAFQNFFIRRNEAHEIEIIEGSEINEQANYDENSFYHESLRIKQQNNLADFNAKSELQVILLQNNNR